MKLILILSIAFIAIQLSGCGTLLSEDKLPTLANELRITEYGAAIEGGNMLTPVQGEGMGSGVRISFNGTLPDDLQVYYQGTNAIVCMNCEEAPALQKPLWAILNDEVTP